MHLEPRFGAASTIAAGASESVTMAVSRQVRQNVANAVRPHFELSTMPMTSVAPLAMRRLICASSSVASLSPASSVNRPRPGTPSGRSPSRTGPSPSWPTRERASQRTNPPGIATVMPGMPASSDAIRRPFVITVRWSQPPRSLRWRATASAVVLASRAMLSPSTTIAAASRPMASFSARWSRSRTSNARSAPRPTADRPAMRPDQPPLPSSVARSLRIVTRETPNRAARSATRARPCSSTMRAMCSWRSSAKTSGWARGRSSQAPLAAVDRRTLGCGA